jgi:hypothetical protein
MISINRKAIILVMVFCLMVMAACSSAPIRFNQAPAKPIDLSKGREISSEACGFQLLLVIPIMTNGRAERAYTELLAKAQGGYITNVQSEESWFYGFVGTGYCTKLTAMTYPFQSQ